MVKSLNAPDPQALSGCGSAAPWQGQTSQGDRLIGNGRTCRPHTQVCYEPVPIAMHEGRRVRSAWSSQHFSHNVCVVHFLNIDMLQETNS